jgi:uncharacterized membrane protein YfcA
MTAGVLFAVAAILIGFSKTSIGGVATISIAIFASLMPARESTAAVLLVLITGDLLAVWHYRHDCDWSLLRHLIPAVLPGLVLGALFLRVVDDTLLRRSIGVIIIALAILQFVLRRRPEATSSSAVHGKAVAVVAGVAAGFTTMTANAAGAVMTLYLLARGVDKRRFLGTGAWFFLGVNLCKLPFSAGLGLFTASSFTRALALAPAVFAGGLVGIATIRRISQVRFEQVVLAASALAALALLR